MIVDNDPAGSARDAVSRLRRPRCRLRQRDPAGHRRGPQPGAGRGRRRRAADLHRRRRASAATAGWTCCSPPTPNTAGRRGRPGGLASTRWSLTGGSRPAGSSTAAGCPPGRRSTSRRPTTCCSTSRRCTPTACGSTRSSAPAAARTPCSPGSWPAAGGRMVWCDEAVVDRHGAGLPGDPRDWVLRRAFRSGNSWTRTSLEMAPSIPRRTLIRLQTCGDRCGPHRCRGGVGAAGHRHPEAFPAGPRHPHRSPAAPAWPPGRSATSIRSTAGREGQFLVISTLSTST